MENSSTSSSHYQQNSNLDQEFESFQKEVNDRFVDLSLVGNDDLLSLSWVGKLLDSFLCIQEEFRFILHNHQTLTTKSPVDRLVVDCFDRNVKALDICNAIRDGIEQIRQWQKLLEIVLSALNCNNNNNISEGQFRRAKKALIDLGIGMLDDNKDSNASLTHRNRSFSRNSMNRDHHHNYQHHHYHQHHQNFRSISWSVSRSWSAFKQLQSIGNNLNPPKPNDLVVTNGLAIPIFTMNSILLFVMWTLVAAIPCQDRGLHIHFSTSRQFSWAGPCLSLHERIMEESKKRERRNCCGLLKEIHEIENCVRVMNEMADSVKFPLTEEKESEIRERVEEVSKICEALREGLEPLKRHVREVFHRIVRGRTEGLDALGKLGHLDS